MANQVDGTVLVLQAHHTPRDVAIQAKTLLDQAQARPLGLYLMVYVPRTGRIISTTITMTMRSESND